MNLKKAIFFVYIFTFAMNANGKVLLPSVPYFISLYPTSAE